MEEKMPINKARVFGAVFVVLFLGILIVSAVGYYDYKKEADTNALNSVQQQIESQTGQSVTQKVVKGPDPLIKNPLTSVNPRMSFQNSSG